MGNQVKKATLRNVAESANVSVTVASRVVGNYGYVSLEKKKRVLKIAKELGYTPNILARSLKTYTSFCIGVVIADITTSFFNLLVRGADDVARQNGYHLIICNSDESPKKEKDHLEELSSRKVDGIILCPTEKNIHQLKKITRAGMPLVLVDRKLKEIDAVSITVDNSLGAMEGVNHLIQHGYRRIGLIKGLPGISALEERFLGYKQALHAAGIPLDQELIRYGEFNAVASRKAALELLQLKKPPDAFFIASEAMIVGTILAIRERNLRIPEDIGIVGFDDPLWAPLLDPPLTTIRQPSYSVGTIAAQKLISQLRGSGDAGNSRKENIVLRPELVIRASCGEGATGARAAGRRRT
jgi:DNA-binding LacI/PurR family transcriptional regulator